MEMHALIPMWTLPQEGMPNSRYYGDELDLPSWMKTYGKVENELRGVSKETSIPL